MRGRRCRVADSGDRGRGHEQRVHSDGHQRWQPPLMSGWRLNTNTWMHTEGAATADVTSTQSDCGDTDTDQTTEAGSEKALVLCGSQICLRHTSGAKRQSLSDSSIREEGCGLVVGGTIVLLIACGMAPVPCWIRSGHHQSGSALNGAVEIDCGHSSTYHSALIGPQLRTT